MTRSRFTRRRYLAGGAALGLAGLAGCTDGGPGEGDEGVGDEAPEEEETADEQEGEQLENNESTEGQDPDDSGNETDGNETDGNETDQESVEDIDYENPDGEVSFVQPEDGDEVAGPVEVEAEVENFELRPAEEEEPEQGAGHLHVIVDQGCLQPEYVIPQEEGYHHLSEGETTTELELEPGEHDLCLQASDAMHVAYDATDEITIEVTDDGGDGNETDGNESGGNETNESGGNGSDSNASDE